jgi:hypothetical protein
MPEGYKSERGFPGTPSTATGTEDTMGLLETLAERFIDMETSEEYKKADRLVKDQGKRLETVKKLLKEQNRLSVKIRRGRKIKTLKFDIRKMRKVDTLAMPEEIRQEYMTEIDAWWKQVDVLDLTEEMDAVLKEEEDDVIIIKEEEDDIRAASL